jgi:uncharacterized protein (TIGR02145 family)
LGATLYFFLTGGKPTQATSRMMDGIKSPSEINPKISAQISSAIMLAMEVKPEDRFQSIADFRNALDTLAEENVTVPPIGKTIIIDTPVAVETHVTDLDGNEYPIVKIGKQLWLGENLRTTRFQNGDEIWVVNNKEKWRYAFENKLPACAWFNFDNSSKPEYGLYYNFHALNDARNICPEGFRIPNTLDLNSLSSFINHQNEDPKVLISKKESIEGWLSINQGLDKYGLNLHLSGYLYSDSFIFYSCNFELEKKAYLFLIKDEIKFSGIHIDLENPILIILVKSLESGFNIRCIKKQENE